LNLEKIKHGIKTLAACRGIRGVDDTSSSLLSLTLLHCLVFGLFCTQEPDLATWSDVLATFTLEPDLVTLSGSGVIFPLEPAIATLSGSWAVFHPGA
jgi:hypothetical protein